MPTFPARAGESYHIWVENLASRSQSYRIDVRTIGSASVPPGRTDTLSVGEPTAYGSSGVLKARLSSE
ncbi:MAG: hypothetical protein ACT4QD_27255 [Acidobacteriota bacterium]